jgi:hypothetical protein
VAARRLVIVLVLVLALSTLAAALVPPQAEREGAPGGMTTRGKPGDGRRDERAPERLVRGVVDAGTRKRETIELRRGDELALTVRSPVPDQVEIPALGRIEHVSRDDPARFDLLPGLTGAFEVRLVEGARVVGRIAVRSRR